METSRAIKILLVEDDLADLELALRFLRRGNLSNHIRLARDGAEALDFIFGEGTSQGRPEGEIPDLVLLDLKLPRVDGIEVIERLQGDPRTREIPIFVLTGDKKNPRLDLALSMGVCGYLIKPVTFQSLIEAVAKFGYVLEIRTPEPSLN